MLEQIGIGDNFDAVSEIAIMQALLLLDHQDTPFNRIRNAFARKKMAIVQAPTGTGFVTTSMPLDLIGIDEDAYDFQVAYMPLSSKYAALFSADKRVTAFGSASLEEIAQFNTELLANNLWDVAMSQAKEALEVAVSRWKSFEKAQ